MSYRKVIEFICDSCDDAHTSDDETTIPSGWFELENIDFLTTKEQEGELNVCEDCSKSVAWDLFMEHVQAEG